MEVKKKKTIAMGVWSALICVFLALCVMIGKFLLESDYYTLSISLEGESEIFLQYGTPYEEPGYTIRFHGAPLFQGGIEANASVVVENGIPKDRLGKFTVRYSAEYLGHHAYTERVVWVVDTEAPVIELLGDLQPLVSPGEQYEEAGFRAYDNYDGDISHRVIRIEEEGKIFYSVADSSGNPFYAVRELPGYDPIPPEIILTGGNMLSIPLGKPYVDPGYKALDNVDGDLSDYVSVEGSVNWMLPGRYPVTYSASDSFGNNTSVTRIVEVPKIGNPEVVFPEGKIIYLTFDDGPGPYTLQLLDILDAYGVKATFFVVGAENENILREITRRGHSIGIHSVTHDYESIYSSPEAFFEDLYSMQEIIHQATGVRTTLMRFPGGGSNTVSSTTPGIMTMLTELVQAAGFQYFDWNVDSGDASTAYTKNAVLNNLIDGVGKEQYSVTLQHDIHPYSVAAVEEFIAWAQENGYQFLPLQPDSPLCHHTVAN